MPFGIANFESLPYPIKLAFEDLEVWLRTFLTQEHNEDGTHGTPAAGVAGANGAAGASAFDAASRHWRGQGAWLLDSVQSSTPDVVSIRPPKLSGGTYHNYAPQGIDDAVALELEPDGSAVTLTGLKAKSGLEKRFFFLRNRDSSLSVHLRHLNSGSLGPNQFDLPSATDVELAAGQSVWVYYDPDRDGGKWTFAITGVAAGGAGSFASDSNVFVATLSLTDAQIKSLNTAPQDIVAAQGAGTRITPLMLQGRWDYSAGGYSANRTVRVLYTGGSTDLITAQTWVTTATGAFDSFSMNIIAVGTQFDSATRNTKVVIQSSGDVTGGNAANSLKLRLYYTIQED